MLDESSKFSHPTEKSATENHLNRREFTRLAVSMGVGMALEASAGAARLTEKAKKPNILL